MAHCDVEPVYSLRLTSREFRIVTLSLVGILPEQEQKDADELNVHLCKMRANHLRSQAEIAEKARDKAVSLTEEERTE